MSRRRGKPRRADLVGKTFTINITQEVIDQATREGLSGAQMIALAIQASIPGATDIEVNGQNLWSPGHQDPASRPRPTSDSGGQQP